MRVKCISNSPKDSKGTHQYLGSSTGSNRDVYNLTIGKEYVVYAIATIGSETIYLIIDETQKTYLIAGGWSQPRPLWFDAKLFEVVDEIIDPTWIKVKCEVYSTPGEVYSFPEFNEKGNEFYSALFEGHKKEVDIFVSYMRKYEDPGSLDIEEVSKKQKLKDYESGVQMAKERGWELPDKYE